MYPFPAAAISWVRASSGLFNYGLASAFAHYGLTELHAGFGQTVLALVPLLSLLLAVAHGQKRLSRAGLAGTLLAAAGVAVMSGFSLEGSLPVLAVMALIGGALSPSPKPACWCGTARGWTRSP